MRSLEPGHSAIYLPCATSRDTTRLSITPCTGLQSLSPVVISSPLSLASLPCSHTTHSITGSPMLCTMERFAS